MGRTGEAELTYQDFWMQRPFLQANSVSGSQVREWQMAVSSSLPSRQSLSPSHFHVPKIHRPVELHLNWYAPNEEKIALPRLHKETNQASRCLVRRLHRYKKNSERGQRWRGGGKEKPERKKTKPGPTSCSGQGMSQWRSSDRSPQSSTPSQSVVGVVQLWLSHWNWPALQKRCLHAPCGSSEPSWQSFSPSHFQYNGIHRLS